MKYLNTYKLFESTTAGDVKLDCEEILLELTDIGFEVNIAINTWEKEFFNPNIYTIDWVNVILKNDKEFSIKDVKEYISRLTRYLKNFELKKDVSNSYLIERKNFRDPDTFQYVKDYWELDIIFTQNKW